MHSDSDGDALFDAQGDVEPDGVDAGLPGDPWAVGADPFGDELAGVDAQDWPADTDVLWGPVDEPQPALDADFDLPL